MQSNGTILTETRWKNLLATFGRTVQWKTPYDDIVAAYTQTHRHYHNADHIGHCLDEFDDVRHLAVNANEVELSIWLHDVVYKPRSGSNEKKSAQWAAGILSTMGCAEPVIGRVSALILATQHHEPSEDIDTQLLLDIDLSILGQSTDLFDKYEKAVRKEYKWVPRAAYRIGRKKVLKAFADMPRIFQTQVFMEKYEERARHNLHRSISLL